jgi:hypothetical protein
MYLFRCVRRAMRDMLPDIARQVTRHLLRRRIGESLDLVLIYRELSEQLSTETQDAITDKDSAEHI